MGIDIVFIVGGDNSGKSTLLRALTGKGRDWNRHPFRSNIVRLIWGRDDRQVVPTLCLNSSLNEGWKYPRNEFRFAQDDPRETVAPWDLKTLLDLYEKEGCKKAILCIATHVDQRDWLAADYAGEINSGLGAHRVSHVVSLSEDGARLVNINSASFLTTDGRAPANEVAALVRNHINLI